MEAYLMHHGILGQKWGVRRYQNDDGSLTPKGRQRYSDDRDELEYYRKKQHQKEVAGKVAVGLAVAGMAALTAYTISSGSKIKKQDYGSAAKKQINDTTDMLKNYAEAEKKTREAIKALTNRFPG